MLHIWRLHTALLHWQHKQYQNKFLQRAWFILEFGAQRWSGRTCCDGVMNKCSHSCLSDDTSLLTCATVTGWAVPHVYCLHPRHEAVKAEFFLDFLTLKKALHSLKHHKLLTQQQNVTSQLPYNLWTYLHLLKHYPVEVKLYSITLQGVLLENI
jgi:hypothetical protein